MDIYRLIAQTIGFGGAASLIGSYQCKSARMLFAVQMLGHVLYVIHFAMLGALSGSVSLAVAIFRGVVFFNADKRWARHPAWLWLFLGLTVAACAATWKNIFSLLPCLGVLVPTYAMWSANGKKIRLATLFVSSPCWLAYDIYAWSPSGVLCEVFTISSIIISIMRYGMKALDVSEAVERK